MSAYASLCSASVFLQFLHIPFLNGFSSNTAHASFLLVNCLSSSSLAWISDWAICAWNSSLGMVVFSSGESGGGLGVSFCCAVGGVSGLGGSSGALGGSGWASSGLTYLGFLLPLLEENVRDIFLVNFRDLDSLCSPLDSLSLLDFPPIVWILYQTELESEWSFFCFSLGSWVRLFLADSHKSHLIDSNSDHVVEKGTFLFFLYFFFSLSELLWTSLWLFFGGLFLGRWRWFVFLCVLSCSGIIQVLLEPVQSKITRSETSLVLDVQIGSILYQPHG